VGLNVRLPGHRMTWVHSLHSPSLLVTQEAPRVPDSGPYWIPPTLNLNWKTHPAMYKSVARLTTAYNWYFMSMSCQNESHLEHIKEIKISFHSINLMLVGAINGLLNLVDIYSAVYGFCHFRFSRHIARQSDSSPATTPYSQGKSHLRDLHVFTFTR